MSNNYGIIICDTDRKANAGNLGRELLNGTTATWQRRVFKKNKTVVSDSVKSTIPCDGTFTGHFIILAHGNYNAKNTMGHLYVEDPKGAYTEITNNVIDCVNGIALPNGITKKIYIFACGQGRDPILRWFKGADAFNCDDVWCPCTTSTLGGAIDKNDIKKKFGLL
jgi:hypothetical protein